MNQCDIVQDLLPLYVEELTRMTSSEMIEDHLKTCPECSAVLAEMSQPIDAVPFPKKELDYLKKVRRKVTKAHRVAIALAIIMVVAFARFFILGELATVHDIGSFSYTYSEADNTLTISGTLNNSNAVQSARVRSARDSNATIVSVHTVLPSFIFRSRDFSVALPYADDLYVELQESGNREMIFNSIGLTPHIGVVRNGEFIDGRFLERREMGDNIKAIVMASTDTGIKSTGAEPQADYLQITIVGSGTSSASSEFPKTRIFVYERDGKYYSEAEGENIRQLTAEQYEQIRSYIGQADVSMEVVGGDKESSLTSEVVQ
jgi:hypothetical protein